MSDAPPPIDENRRRNFERRWLDQNATRPDIAEFLPDASDPTFEGTLLELVCIDMEMRCRNGDPPSVSEYLTRLPLDESRREHLTRERDYLARRSVSTGSRVGRYVLRGVLGQGAFAEVWRALDPDLGREVALKRLRPELGDDEEARARFQREARSAASLRHPAIVTVHEVGDEAAGPFLVCDLIAGPTLAKEMGDRTFDPRESATVVARLADALDYAHQCGVVHRDVKPGNILLDEAGRPLLTDFGLARLATADVALTRRGEVLGTPAYMSPEQMLGDTDAIDGRSDVFSLGAVLYGLLCGRTPFSGENTAALSYAVVHKDVPPPRRFRASVPADLETICLKAMAREPDRRYATAGAFADDLRRFLAREPIHARRRGPIRRLALWARRNPALGVALVAIVVISTVAFVRILAERANTRAELYRTLVREAEAQLALPRGAGLEAAWRSVGDAAAVDTDVRDSLELRNLALRYLTSQAPHFRQLATWTDAREVATIALSRDATRLYEAGPGGTRVRDTKSGTVLASDPAPAHAMAAAGKRIAVANGRSVRLLDASRLEPIATIDCAGEVTALALDSRGRTLATGGPAGPVEVWDVGTPEPKRLYTYPYKVHCLLLANDASALATGGTDKLLRLIDLPQSEVRWTCTCNNPIRALAWGNGHLAAVVWENLTVVLVSLKNGGKREPQSGHDAAVRAAFFAPGETVVVTASADGALAAWDMELARVAETRVGGTALKTAAAAADRIVTLDVRGRRTLWEIAPPNGRTTWYSTHGAVFVPGTQRVFAGHIGFECGDKTLHYLAAPPRKVQTWGVAADAQARRVARTSHKGRIILCDAGTFEVEHELLAEGPIAWRAAFHPDGSILATGSGNDIVLWDTKTGRERGRLRGHEGTVAALAFDPSGRLLASASGKTIRIWDWEQQSKTALLQRNGAVHDLIYSGDTLMGACGDGTLLVWRPGANPESVRVSDEAVWAVAVGPDGTVATGSQAGIVRLWDPGTWRVRAVLPGVRRVRYLSFDDAGRYLVASVYLGDGALWDLPWLRGQLGRLGLDWK